MSLQEWTSGTSNDARAMMLFEANKKSTIITYLFWLFLGLLGGHRFYAGKIVTAVFQLMLLPTFIIVGSIFPVAITPDLVLPIAALATLWWLIDALLIPSWIRKYNSQLAINLAR